MRMIYPKYISLCIFSASCLLLIFCGGIIPKIAAQDSNSTIDLKIDDKSYPIIYNITGGKLSSITAMKENSTLALELVTSNDGTLILTLPRNIMDSKNPQNKDEDYIVFADGVPIGADQITTNNRVRTLSIDFDKGVDQIEIAGTRIVPEFGPLAAPLLAIGIMVVLVAAAKLTKFVMPRNSL